MMNIKEIVAHLKDRILQSPIAKKSYEEDGDYTIAIQDGKDLIIISIFRGAK